MRGTMRGAHCIHGHERTPENVDGRGGCRQCTRSQSNATYARNRESRKQRMRDARKANPELFVYHGAKNRCMNPNNTDWPSYGGRGIKFNFLSFAEFFSCVGKRPSPTHILDRINNDGNYEPGNVRWVTQKESFANRKRRDWLNQFSTEELVAELARRRR
jgi:hypothetical protein